MYMRWGALAFMVVLLAACPSCQAGSSVPAGMASPGAAPKPSQAVSFSCKLPVSTIERQAAFISFPFGEVTIDPKGDGGLYYDRPFSRWLPARREAVSPDGTHYAYAEGGPGRTSKVHVVEVTTGADRAFDAPLNPSFMTYAVVEYANEGIYLGQAWESPLIGLWLLDSTTGEIKKVTDLQDIQISAGSRILWVGTVNPSDARPLSAAYVFSNQIDRFSLTGSSRAPWYYRPGAMVSVLGVDLSGHPIARVINGKDGLVSSDLDAELLLLLDPKSQRTIFKGSAKLIGSLGSPIADRHGIWFGSPDGIYLYSKPAGLQKVSSQAGYPANNCS